MMDLDLTPAQWRMARQAGAAFTDEQTPAIDPAVGQQLALPGMGPALGELYRNVHTGQVGCVVATREGRRGWVTLRVNDRLTDVDFTWLGKHWVPARADGTAR